MILDPRQLLFRPRGRLDRPSFVIGLILFKLAMVGLFMLMRWLDPATAAGFWMGLAIFLVFPFMLYSVFGQRLHDMGRTVWPLTGLLFASFLVLIGVMLAYGGDEFFAGFSQFERKDAIDPETVKALQDAYRAEMATGGTRVAEILLGGIWGAFIGWLLLTPGQAHSNAYGEPVGPRSEGSHA